MVKRELHLFCCYLERSAKLKKILTIDVKMEEYTLKMDEHINYRHAENSTSQCWTKK